MSPPQSRRNFPILLTPIVNGSIIASNHVNPNPKQKPTNRAFKVCFKSIPSAFEMVDYLFIVFRSEIFLSQMLVDGISADDYSPFFFKTSPCRAKQSLPFFDGTRHDKDSVLIVRDMAYHLFDIQLRRQYCSFGEVFRLY